MTSPFRTHDLTWREISIEIIEKTNTKNRETYIGVRVLKPRHVELPITTWGFTSKWLDSEEVSLAGGAVAYVTAWLEREAVRRKWQYHNWRQLDLFKLA
jgi:hypothetical protein